MNSLRGRLLIWLLGLLTLMSVVAGVVAYALNRQEVDASLDAQLRQIALSLGKTDLSTSFPQGDGAAIDPEDSFVITIWNADGVATSSDPDFSTRRPDQSGYLDFETEGEAWRGYARTFQGYTILVAQRLVVRAEFAANSAMRAVLPIAVLIPLSWLGIGWIVNRALHPIHAVTDELRHWGKVGTNPLSVEHVPSEILPLALATNELITRLQAQLEFREQFISDAAHELRTPLTALQLQVRNLTAAARSAEQKALVAEMTVGVRRMSELIGKLLQLARTDASAPLPAAEPVDLDSVIAAAIQSVMPIAAEKQIDIGLTTDNSERVLANADEIRTLLGSLVENAVRYTDRGGVIDLSVERNAGEVVLQVMDTGPGIPDAQLERVFDRFVRLAAGDTEGSGLGLAVARAIADRWGARLVLANRRDRTGLVAWIHFPGDGEKFGSGSAERRVPDGHLFRWTADRTKGA